MRWINSEICCVLVAVCLAALPMVVDAQELQEATLKEFVLQAIETHEMVQIADSEIRRAQADVSLAKSILLPKLDANGSYTFYDDDLSIELSPDESFVIRPRQDWTASIDLRQNLFTGLRAFRARDIAKLNRDIADLDRWTTINNLTIDGDGHGPLPLFVGQQFRECFSHCGSCRHDSCFPVIYVDFDVGHKLSIYKSKG